jgi:hypothetical protein
MTIARFPAMWRDYMPQADFPFLILIYSNFLQPITNFKWPDPWIAA